ncbi:hypothetical protein [Streptomyces sp. PH10-H1]|uniref:hypothetical protein n=1 Tax=Streptomyces sp. PH10-H1 TaxID=3046212 RepID=UPI0024BB4B9B|nr:hypothetical protein [Streptomyces sp. PH10-H1]MDJ0341786.1 hypothetical protein [Streptomyces sp. PH10-H1]
MTEHLTIAGVQGAIALVTARLARLDVPQEQILGDTPAQEALAALSAIVVSVLEQTVPDHLVGALRRAGVTAGQWEAER